VRIPGGDGAGLKSLLNNVDGVKSVQVESVGSSNRFRAQVESSAGRDIRAKLAAKIVTAGHELEELRSVSLSLEDIFLQLTTDESAEKAAGKEAAK
jgi:ABC-2 type transport system ATP-binding protein